MIDVLINKRTRLPVAAKPAGSKWGYREIDGPNLCVVTLDDPPAELAARVAKRGVVANPFAEYAVDPAWQGDAEASPVTKLASMVRQSTVKLRANDVRRGASVRLTDMELVAERRE